MAREALITEEGLEKLKSEIEHLSTTKRREVAARIKEAREFGDISENSEYDDAKNEQALLEQRIAQLEERLRRASVVDQKDDRHRDRERRRPGPRQGPEVRRFAQVPDRRPDRGEPREQKLSHESPIGKALLGHKRGDLVTVDVPRGPKKKLKITKIETA